MGSSTTAAIHQIGSLHSKSLFSCKIHESSIKPCWRSKFNGNVFDLKSDFKSPALNSETFKICSAIKSKPVSKESNDSSSSPQSKKASSSGFGSKSPSGFGSKSSSNSGGNTAALLKRSQNLYVKLIKKFQVAGLSREFVVCVRYKSDSNSNNKPTSGSQKLNDWLPVSEIILVSELESHLAFQSALPFVCREITECATSIIKKIQYHELEFCFENLDSFYDHVVKGLTNPEGEVQEECPYSVLGIPKNSSPRLVRTKYRELASIHHPDKHIDGDQETAQTKFKRITNAYERIKRSGNASDGDLGGSYETLGGNARVGLSEPFSVTQGMVADKAPPGIEIAVRPLDLEIVQLFMLKSAANSIL